MPDVSIVDLIARARGYAHEGKLPAPAHAYILGLADALEDAEKRRNAALDRIETWSPERMSSNIEAFRIILSGEQEL